MNKMIKRELRKSIWDKMFLKTLFMGTGIVALWSAIGQITMFLERNAFDKKFRKEHTAGANEYVFCSESTGK